MFADIRQYLALSETPMLRACGGRVVIYDCEIKGQPSEDVGHTTDPLFFDARVPPSAYDKSAAYTPSS